MMHLNEKRRAVANALSRLETAGSLIVNVSTGIAMPVITIEFPPVWLVSKSNEVREQAGKTLKVSHIAKLSGCLVRWVESETDNINAKYMTQYLNPYAPELIAVQPKNF